TKRADDRRIPRSYAEEEFGFNATPNVATGKVRDDPRPLGRAYACQPAGGTGRASPLPADLTTSDPSIAPCGGAAGTGRTTRSGTARTQCHVAQGTHALVTTTHSRTASIPKPSTSWGSKNRTSMAADAVAPSAMVGCHHPAGTTRPTVHSAARAKAPTVAAIRTAPMPRTRLRSSPARVTAHDWAMSKGHSAPPSVAAGVGTANRTWTTPWPTSRAASSQGPAAMS